MGIKYFRFTSGAADGLYTLLVKLQIHLQFKAVVVQLVVMYIHPVRFGGGGRGRAGDTTTFDNTTMPLSSRGFPGHSINGGHSTYPNSALIWLSNWGKRDVGDDITNGTIVCRNRIKNVILRNRLLT